MKNLIKIIGSAVLLIMFSLALSSYDSVQPADDPGNGVEVTIYKNIGWVLNSGCGSFMETSSTTQMKDGELHMLTIKWDLSEAGPGCFDVDVATKINIGTPYGVAQGNLTPSGQLILKLIVN